MFRDIEQALKIRKNRNLALEGKTVILIILVISKVFFQSFITAAQKHILNGLEKIK